MAGIDDIIAGGAGASSRADFSGLGDIAKTYWEGKDQAAKNDLREAFKGGVPKTSDGQPDYLAIAKTFFEKGDPANGVAVANLAQQQQNIQQNREGANFVATGGQPQAGLSVIDAPSPSRTIQGQVAPALNKGGAQDQGGLQGSPTVMKILAQHVPNDQLGAASESVMRQLADVAPGLKATDPIDINDPRIINVLRPAVAQIKRMGIGQVQPPQPGDNQPPPQQPQQVAQQPQAQPVAQPQQSPFGNAIAAGLIPPGVDPARYVAGLKYRAAALPKGPAQEVIQSQVNAIDKAIELTSGQRDYSAAQANPKLNDFQNQQEADKASAVAIAGNDVKESQSYIDNAKVAQQRLGTLNTISNVIGTDKNLNLGFGSETTLKIKMALEKAGIDFGDLSGAQLIQKLNGVLASESTKALATRPTQFEFKTFLGNNPGLALDEKGNIRMLGILSQNAKREVDLGRLARANRNNWDNWDNVVEAYDKKNPIKDPTTGKILSSNSIIAPGPSKGATPVSGSAQAAPAAFPNAKKAPDGNWYVPDPARPGKYSRVVQ